MNPKRLAAAALLLLAGMVAGLAVSLRAQTGLAPDLETKTDSKDSRTALKTDSAAAPAAVAFTKDFPGSDPAYYSIVLKENGDALYRTAPDETPVEFHVSEDSTQHIFALAQKLGFFHGIRLESGRKVAQMGKKTFAYENAGDRAEVSFNHTDNVDAAALLDLFERLSTTMRHRDQMEYLVRYDRLGVVQELLQLEIDLDHGRLLEPALLAPMLEKIRANQALVNVARERASDILAKLQAAHP